MDWIDVYALAYRGTYIESDIWELIFYYLNCDRSRICIECIFASNLLYTNQPERL